MTKFNILFIGTDVHKESNEIAIADDSANGEVRRYARIGGTLDVLHKTLRKLVLSAVNNKNLYWFSAYHCQPPENTKIIITT